MCLLGQLGVSMASLYIQREDPSAQALPGFLQFGLHPHPPCSCREWKLQSLPTTAVSLEGRYYSSLRVIPLPEYEQMKQESKEIQEKAHM